MPSKPPVPDRVRVLVVQRYGLVPGVEMHVPCHYCKRLGRVYWPQRKDGRGATRVRSKHEFDHVVPEHRGGETVPSNIVLACRPCNRSKGTNDAPARWAIDGLAMNVKGAPLARH